MSYQPVLALGYLQPNVSIFPAPIVAARDPAASDFNYPIGQEWVNSSTHVIFFLTNVASAAATWVNSTTAGAINTITGNSGGAESPAAGNFNVLGTGSITVAGSANTETVQLTGLTTHNVLIGAGTATITKVAPSATVGVALVSAGAAVDPAFGTVVVAGGGTGLTTLTAHALYVGNGASAPTALAVGATGTLLAGATGADPAFTASPSVTGSVTAGTTLTATLGAITATNGNLVLGTAGNKIVSTSVASTTTAGANSFGTVTIVNGTATVNTTAVTASSIIMLTRQSPGTTGAAALGMLSVGTITAATSFVINALTTANSTTVVAADESVVGWMIIN